MKESLIYPGEYTPLYSMKPLLKDFILAKKSKRVQPAINMDEHVEEYKLEIAMPGISRDQIIIYVHQNTLSIAVISSGCNIPKDKKTKTDEANIEYFHRHISLPANVDTIFAAASLRAGVLCICLPKTNRPGLINANQVIVY